MTAQASVATDPTSAGSGSGENIAYKTVDQQIVEFVSDSGEGAQTAGQLLGTVSAKLGYGVWTVEIIPAEIEPPVRTSTGASGNRVRIGTQAITNLGNTADIVVAFNEQVLYSRIDVGALREGTHILLENKWATDIQTSIREQYATALADFKARGYIVHEVPMEVECLKLVNDPRRGKNIWALGMISAVYGLKTEYIQVEIRNRLGKKGEKVVQTNFGLLDAGYQWALNNLDLRYRIPVVESTEDRVVMNGNTAIGLGAMAAGFELCSMYPITPATSASHYLAANFRNAGGFVHQSEDELAAIGVAIGASFAGKTALTISSGPGIALKTEMIGLAVMTEIPLVIVNVQRGGPSTGLPTRVEQGDLLNAMFAATGDAPKIVMAVSTIEECFHFMVTARRLAEEYRGPVFVLTDANLATGQQNFKRPEAQFDWFAPPLDQSDWDPEVAPYDWDDQTGLSPRPIVGQRGGEYVLTGLAHNEHSKVAYESATNQRAMRARSRKLATLFKALKPPKIYGDDEGDLLVVGWGSTRGAIEEAVDSLRAKGVKVSSVNLHFLSPLEPGLKEIFSRFNKVLTIEINYSDDYGDPTVPDETRRYSQLALILRAQTLVDVQCWSRVPGIPLSPATIEAELRNHLNRA